MSQTKDDDYKQMITDARDSMKAQEAEKAVELLSTAAKLFPEGAETYALLSVIAASMKDAGRAIEMMNAAHKLDMECAEYPQALAVLHAQVGNLTDSIFFAKLSTALKPNEDFPDLLPESMTNYSKIMTNPGISTNLVSAMYAYNSRKFDKSVEHCISEIRINPGNLDAQRLLAKGLYRVAKYERAVATLHGIIHQEPGNAEDQAILGKVLIALGRTAEALVCLKSAHEMYPSSVEVHTAVMSGLDQLGETAIARKIAQQWKKSHKAKKKKGSVEPLEGRPVRLGYISDSLFHCDIANYIEPLIKYHNREKFEIYCYQNFLVKDSLSYSLENQAFSWREVYDTDDETLSNIIENDDLDILIDLSGYTEWNKLELVSKKPARHMAAWIGEPAALTGAGIDLVLSNDITAATDKKAALAGTKCVNLGEALICMEPPEVLPAPSPAPALENEYITFGGSCELHAITPELAAVWSRVLNAVPVSKLILGNGKAISDEVQKSLFELFAHFGMAERIEFFEPEENQGEGAELEGAYPLLGLFAKTDIFLASPSSSFGLDVSHALWMGLPTVSMTANHRSAQMQSSILLAASHQEWIAEGVDNFVSIVAALAANPQALADMRQGMRNKLRGSALFSPQQFVANFEKNLSENL